MHACSEALQYNSGVATNDGCWSITLNFPMIFKTNCHAQFYNQTQLLLLAHHNMAQRSIASVVNPRPEGYGSRLVINPRHEGLR